MCDPNYPTRRFIALLCLSLLSATSLAAAHEPHEWQDDDHSYDKARRAVERGDALPIGEVLRRLRSEVPGDVVATEYEFEFHRWVYEFKVVDPQGRIRKVHLDAATGEMIDEAHE